MRTVLLCVLAACASLHAASVPRRQIVVVRPMASCAPGDRKYAEALSKHAVRWLREGGVAVDLADDRAMEQVQTPVAVLCDANTHLSPDAILHIVSAFADPQVGCVAGEKRVARSAQTTEADHTEGAYWRYESLLKS